MIRRIPALPILLLIIPVLLTAESGRKIIILLAYNHPRIRQKRDHNAYVRARDIPEFPEYVRVVVERRGHLAAGIEL